MGVVEILKLMGMGNHPPFDLFPTEGDLHNFQEGVIISVNRRVMNIDWCGQILFATIYLYRFLFTNRKEEFNRKKIIAIAKSSTFYCPMVAKVTKTTLKLEVWGVDAQDI